LKASLKSQIPPEIRLIWKPPEEISIPDWIERNVRLPKLTAAEPGPLRISWTPYTRGPLLALGSPWIEHIVAVWGRQTAKSQGILYPFLCYAIAQDPGPAICLLPTENKAKYTSKKRLQPMFDSCPAISEKKTDNPDDYNILEMQFRDMVLSMVWGGSATNLTTRPCRYLLRDEVDELKKALGDDQIDPMKAIEETTSTFSNRKIVDTGTPTTPQGNIWKALETCQYVFEYWVACRNCGVYQILYWDGVRYGDDPDPEAVETNAYYECEACKTEITNLDKIRMLAHGEWRARTTPNPCEQIRKMQRAKIEETISLDDVLKIKTVKKIGFQLPKWYSPFMGGHIGIIAKDYLLAEKKMKDGEDFAPMRNWTIYCAALPYEETAISVEEHELEKNKIDLDPMICPEGTIGLSCGIDPGQGGFWFAVLGWKRDMSPHLIHYGFMKGDYENSGIEDLVKNWMYEISGNENQAYIWRIGVDTGGGEYSDKDATMTEAAYLWIRKMKRKGLFGTKGMSHSYSRKIKESKIDRMPGKEGKIIPGGLILVEINTDAVKDSIWFHLDIEEGKSGRFTFHNNTGHDLMRHLTAEEKILDAKKNKYVWVRKRANHLLDCMVIAFALADPEFRGGIRLLKRPFKKIQGDDKKTEPKEESEKSNPKPWVHRERIGGWMKGWRR